MGQEAAGPVAFDFDGALVVARQLWSLADDLEVRRSNRRDNSETARNQWKGPLTTDFDSREGDEYSDAGNIGSQLQDDARAWATAWQAAVLQQRKNYRAAALKEASDNRGFWEKANDTVNPLAEDNSGDDIAEAEAPPLPQPPSFDDGGIDPRANPYA